MKLVTHTAPATPAHIVTIGLLTIDTSPDIDAKKSPFAYNDIPFWLKDKTGKVLNKRGQILIYLACHVGERVSREELRKNIWGTSVRPDGDKDPVDNIIHDLRRDLTRIDEGLRDLIVLQDGAFRLLAVLPDPVTRPDPSTDKKPPAPGSKKPLSPSPDAVVVINDLEDDVLFPTAHAASSYRMGPFTIAVDNKTKTATVSVRDETATLNRGETTLLLKLKDAPRQQRSISSLAASDMFEAKRVLLNTSRELNSKLQALSVSAGLGEVLYLDRVSLPTFDDNREAGIQFVNMGVPVPEPIKVISPDAQKLMKLRRAVAARKCAK